MCGDVLECAPCNLPPGTLLRTHYRNHLTEDPCNSVACPAPHMLQFLLSQDLDDAHLEVVWVESPGAKDVHQVRAPGHSLATEASCSLHYLNPKPPKPPRHTGRV